MVNLANKEWAVYIIYCLHVDCICEPKSDFGYTQVEV